MKRPFLIAALLLITCTVNAQVYFSENFNAGIPGSWTALNGGTTPHTWTGTVNGFSGQYLDGSEFAFVNSDAAGSSSSICLDEILRSPLANTAGAPLLLLEFDHYFRHVGLTDTGFVEVFDGAFWVQVAAFAASTGNFGAPDHQVINLSTLANANLQVRFRYDDNCGWAWYWAVDNVLLHTPFTLDASVTAVTAPAGNGRLLTSSALSAAETITAQVGNPGLDTLVNVPIRYRINGGAIVGPETVPGPIPPQGSAPFSFTVPANLATPGYYLIEVWTGLSNDANHGNDTARIQVRQIVNPPRSLPFCQDFEAATDTVGTGDFVGAISGIDELDFFTSGGPGGRLRTAAGSGFARSGNRALTLDKSPTGTPNAINDVLLTYNLAAYDANTDVILMDFSFMDHGDEVQVRDSVWIRGSDASDWIRVSGWNSVSNGSNGVYFTVAGTDVSALLLSRGQNYSSSFQVRLGQEDNFDASSLIASDGVTFDDICLSLLVNIDAGVTDILQPASQSCGDSLQPVLLVVENLGLDTLSDIPLVISVSGTASFSMLDTLAGPLLPGQSATLLVPVSGFSGGSFQLCGRTQMPGDSIYGNDSICISLNLMPPQSAVVAADTLCSGDSTVLFVDQPNPLFRYTWWDSLSGGNLVKVGDSLATPPLSGDSTWYVEAHSGFRGQVGPPDPSFGTGGNYSLFQDGLVFDVLQPVTIDTVFVYPSGMGTVVVNVLDSGNLLLASTSVTVPGGGRRAIPLGITVYPGTNFRMHALGSTMAGLYRNDTNAVYPYTLQNAISIHNTINGNGPDGFYYFFYDWRLSVPGCAGPRTPVTVKVLQNPPVAGFSALPNYTTVSFSDTSPGTVQSHHWDFGDGNVSTQAQPVHSYQNAGTYQVCLIATNACGSDTVCDSVQVCEALDPGFWAIFNGTSATFSDTSTGAVSWAWTFGDGSGDSLPNPSHVYAAEGNYQVCLTVTNLCQEADSVCDTVAICSPLVAAFGFQQQPGTGLDYVFSDQSQGLPLTFTWDFGDGNGSSQANPVHTFTQTGPLTVTLVITNACGQSDTVSQVLNVVGLEDAAFAGLRVAPNPGMGLFRVEWPEMVPTVMEMEVRDVHGRVVWERVFPADQAERASTIDLRDQAAGMYFLAIRRAGKMAVRRLVKW